MKPYNFYKPRVGINYPTEQVFAAAVLAYTDSVYDASNKTRATDYLESRTEFTQDVLDRAREVIRYYQGLSFKILGGARISPLNLKLMELASADTVTSLDIGAIAFAPQGYYVAKKRLDFDDRVRYAAGGLVGTPGDKFAGTVEVLRCVYSSNYGVHFVTCATESDSIIYFAAKGDIPAGSKITIRGTIKAHRDSQTQLNRVRIDSSGKSN